MPDVKSLVNSKLSKLSQENFSIALEKCSKADQCILEARASGGKDTDLVKQAVDLYQQSIELNSRQVQPYIGLAYISYSAGDLKTAIGLLNKAREIDPINDKVDEMLSLFNDENQHRNLSNAVSKVAGKSLSEKLKTDKKKEINIFEKITSIFVKSTKTKKAEVKNTASAVSQNHVINRPSDNVVQKGNFFEAIRQIKK